MIPADSVRVPCPSCTEDTLVSAGDKHCDNCGARVPDHRIARAEDERRPR